MLTDPVYGYLQSIPDLPPKVGLLLAYEETGYNKAGATGKERKSHLIESWSVDKAQRAGADAVKLLVYYQPGTAANMPGCWSVRRLCGPIHSASMKMLPTPRC